MGRWIIFTLTDREQATHPMKVFLIEVFCKSSNADEFLIDAVAEQRRGEEARTLVLSRIYSTKYIPPKYNARSLAARSRSKAVFIDRLNGADGPLSVPLRCA